MSGVAGGDKYREMAERTTILRVPAGSTLHGLLGASADCQTRPREYSLLSSRRRH